MAVKSSVQNDKKWMEISRRFNILVGQTYSEPDVGNVVNRKIFQRMGLN